MMNAKRIKSQDIINNNSKKTLKFIIERLKQEALIIYPTETIYGIGGIVKPTVKEKIYIAKKRYSNSPLLLVAGNRKIFSDFGIIFNKRANTLAKKFWPGNLSLILRRDNSDEKIGIRVSNHPIIQLLTKLLKMPIYSTSANISGEKYINDPEVIFKKFNKRIDILIDHGILPNHLPSTVVDVSCKNKIKVVREGTIKKEEILKLFKSEIKK